jgi:hypothetical protein
MPQIADLRYETPLRENLHVTLEDTIPYDIWKIDIPQGSGWTDPATNPTWAHHRANTPAIGAL